MNGFNHFAQLNMLTGYAKSKGIPAPALAVGGSGVLLFLGGLSLLLGYHPTIGAVLLMIFLLGVSFGIHNFWTIQDQQAKIGEMTNFLKNMAILGLLLAVVCRREQCIMSLVHRSGTGMIRCAFDGHIPTMISYNPLHYPNN
jgi:uncharacterized membrane protein YphA (DoxX/SURF4 family)